MNPISAIFAKLQTVSSYSDLLYNGTTNKFGVKPENFVLGTRRQESKGAVPQDPNDYPQIRLSVVSSGRGSSAPRVFGMNSSTFDPTSVDSVVPTTCQFMLLTIFRNTAWEQQEPVEQALDLFLESFRPNFQIAGLGVIAYTITNNRKEESSVLTSRQLRTVSRRTITVSCRVYQSVLRS